MSKTRVLVVEDEAISALAVSHMLGMIGCEVTAVVKTGEESIERARVDRPDLVLMDIALQGEMNGIQAAAAIHEDPRTPVVFMTAYTLEELLERHDVPDSFYYLGKPVAERALREVVHHALAERALPRQAHG